MYSSNVGIDIPKVFRVDDLYCQVMVIAEQALIQIIY